MAQLRLVSLAFFVAVLISGLLSSLVLCMPSFAIVTSCVHCTTPVDASSGAHSTTFTSRTTAPTLFGLPRWPIPTKVLFPRPDSSWTVAPPFHWSATRLGGRLWARQRCSTDSSGRFSCLSGDCGTGQVAVQWGGRSAADHARRVHPAGDGGKDFYDVSCVDGFNVPVSVVPSGGSNCDSTSCRTNINARCPAELQMVAPDGSVDGDDDRKKEKTNDRTIE
ncbi:hypothetical protein C4D60_Mb08t12270 [Musa balbisiana]|uniref:Thaumatin-like protein n=1 Tax=Musa balbisiana TaxID=52838 RepID=A0A4V4H8W0_MUSBA|nr:hypothetical protein C4D60_Mb08t12270 [Musa balbisiana]